MAKTPHQKELEQLKHLLNKFFTSYDLANFKKVKEYQLPISIFMEYLSPLETVVKYMKENLHYRNNKIAFILNRSEKTVWQAYHGSQQKYPKSLEEQFSDNDVPFHLLENRELSLFEIIVAYLRERKLLSYHEIAVLLKRDERTIWTVYHRVKAKRKKKR